MQTDCRSIQVASSQGRRFLRRVVAGKIPYCVVSSESRDWRLTFRVDDTGEEILTDSVVTLTGDAQPRASGIYVWEWESPLVARLILDGWKFAVHHSNGSVSTRREGLAILSLRAFHPRNLTGVHPRYVTIGEVTLTKDGKVIHSGDIHI